MMHDACKDSLTCSATGRANLTSTAVFFSSSSSLNTVRAGGLTELNAFNAAFHRIFVERCGNRHLSIALRAILRPTMVARTFLS